MSILLDGKLTDNQLDAARRALALMNLATCTRTENDRWQIARAWQRLESIGGILRRRYEYYCNVQTDEKFMARLERVEQYAHDLAGLIHDCAPLATIKLEHNRDPRGAALKLTIDSDDGRRREVYFG